VCGGKAGSINTWLWLAAGPTQAVSSERDMHGKKGKVEGENKKGAPRRDIHDESQQEECEGSLRK